MRKKKINQMDFGPIVISPNQLNMFPDYAITVPTPPRPTIYTIDKEPLYKSIAELVYDWAGEPHINNFEDTLMATQKIFKNGGFYDDAYSIAKDYERAGYESDAELVDELEEVSSITHQEVKNQIKNWVLKYNIQPEFQVGDKLTESTFIGFSGIVAKVYPETAEIGVKRNLSNDSITTFPQEYFTHKQIQL